MTAVAAIKRVDPVDAFAARAEVRAWLWSIGEITLDEAVDKLQAGAVRDRLVDHIGQDAVELNGRRICPISAHICASRMSHYER